MSLEQFKTQILLLHSEQSTLKKLATGFNDRYTVHCATSGSEALNTLGDTSIDVLVTAQELPGMSGLDALREARRRSPDTLGILLAGNDGEGVEALVGANEVFKVVRGGVTPESLRTLIDDATRQARLIELTESANDMTADVDASAEHIVMETSENGSSIITDATGRMPALDPDKVAPEASVGSRAVDVLVLTKDEEFMATVRESARGMHNIIHANTLAQADEAVQNQKVGVAVVDAAMVGDNVEKLTLHLRTKSPRLVSIVAGRRDDGEMLMDLINRGKVYRFLLKPVSPGRARLAIEASSKHHLEAPDAAFKLPGAPAPAPAPKSSGAVKAGKPAAKPASPPPVAAAKPRPQAEQKVPNIVVEPRPVPVESPTFANDGLGDAFDGEDNSFTETVTGIVKSVGDAFSAFSKRDDTDDVVIPASQPEPPKEPVAMNPVVMNMSIDGSDPDGSILKSPKVLGIGAAAVVALLGLGWWLFGGSDEAAPVADPQLGTPVFTEADPRVETPTDASTSFFGDDALSVDEALAMAESALLARNSADAAAALQQAALADPNNIRLPFLNAQLTQMQLREYLDASRQAIRDGRFEDARFNLNEARALDLNDTTEIEIVASELNASLSDQQVDDVLSKANARLDAGDLTSPSNDNARYYYELALMNDPGNSAALQGLSVVASKLVLQARSEIDAGRFDAAEVLLADARRLDPGSSELASSNAALNSARDGAAEQQRAAADRAAAEQRAADELAAEQAAAAASAQTFAIEATAADALTEEGIEVVANENTVEEPQQTLAADVPAVDEAVDAAPEQAEQSSTIVPVSASALTRTKYVAPKYPRSAQRRGLTGWVELEFTVDLDGSVRNVSVSASDPGVTFVNSAVTAVEKWEFEPIIENGTAVLKRASVRMMFAVE